MIAGATRGTTRHMHRSSLLAAALAAILAPGCFIVDDGEDDAVGGTDGETGADGADEGVIGGLDESGDDGGTASCSTDFALAGVVEGVDADFDGYSVDTTFYNTSLEEVVLDSIDMEVMEAMGLDPDDPEDEARYNYAIRGFDLRNLYTEYVDTGGILLTPGRDISIAFYDLSDHEVQPGTEIDVFDMSPLQAVRNGGDSEALGNVLRELIDEMRTNDKPDVVVTYAPDRSGESLGEQIFIALLSPNARFGTDGVGTFHSLTSFGGGALDSLAYPVSDVGTTSITIDTTIAGAPFSVDSDCLPTAVSG